MGKVILSKGLSALLHLSCYNRTSHTRTGWDCCGCHPGEEKAQGHLVNVHKWLTGECKEIGAQLLTVVRIGQRQWARTETQFPLKTRRHFTVLATEHWRGFPRQAAASSSLKVLKSHLGLVLNDWSRWSLALLDQWGYTKWPPRLLPTSDILCFCEPNWQEEKPWRSKRCQRLLSEDWVQGVS